MPVTVLRIRGTGEVLNGDATMLALLCAKLDASKYSIGADLPYPASVGPANQDNDIFGPSEDTSVAVGEPMLAQAVHDAPGKVGIVAYSLGVLVADRYLTSVAAGTNDGSKLAWVATVASPCRAPGSSIDAGSVSSGINGTHGAWPEGLPVWEAANPRDAITSCAPDSPLRDLAAGISPLTFATLSWTPELAERLRRNQWPVTREWWRDPIGTVRRYGAATAGVEGYIFGGQHTRAYIAEGYLDRLAAKINAWS